MRPNEHGFSNRTCSRDHCFAKCALYLDEGLLFIVYFAKYVWKSLVREVKIDQFQQKEPKFDSYVAFEDTLEPIPFAKPELQCADAQIIT